MRLYPSLYPSLPRACGFLVDHWRNPTRDDPCARTAAAGIVKPSSPFRRSRCWHAPWPKLVPTALAESSSCPLHSRTPRGRCWRQHRRHTPTANWTAVSSSPIPSHTSAPVGPPRQRRDWQSWPSASRPVALVRWAGPCSHAIDHRPRASRLSAQAAPDRARIAAALLRLRVGLASRSGQPNTNAGAGPLRPSSRGPARPSPYQLPGLTPALARRARHVLGGNPIRRPLGLTMAWIYSEGARWPTSSRGRPSAGSIRARTRSPTRQRTVGVRPSTNAPQRRKTPPAQRYTRLGHRSGRGARAATACRPS